MAQQGDRSVSHAAARSVASNGSSAIAAEGIDGHSSAGTSAEAEAGAATSVVASRISDRRLAANRANAQKSTGPRSDAQKLREQLMDVLPDILAGIPVLPGDDRSELLRLTIKLATPFMPMDPITCSIFSGVVSLTWRGRRVARAEELIAGELLAARQRRWDQARAANPASVGPNRPVEKEFALTWLEDMLRNRELGKFAAMQDDIARQIASTMKHLVRMRDSRDAAARADARRAAKASRKQAGKS